nr:telomere maintenance protein sde2 [Quercus suber]
MILSILRSFHFEPGRNQRRKHRPDCASPASPSTQRPSQCDDKPTRPRHGPRQIDIIEAFRCAAVFFWKTPNAARPSSVCGWLNGQHLLSLLLARAFSPQSALSEDPAVAAVLSKRPPSAVTCTLCSTTQPLPYLITGMMAHAHVTNSTMPTAEVHDASAAPAQMVNILLTSFAGLGLPRTLSLPVSASTPTDDVVRAIFSRLPPIKHPLIITTTNNKQLLHSDHTPISTLLASPRETLLPLRLSSRICGGKGGFGSQLRAAGGRMSSRKNRANQETVNGSNRNLDGRRLRTVDEAKRLAEYLAIKPEMERKEKEERRKRWEEVVQAAERREEEIRSGKTGANQGRLDAGYVESKELAEEKTREAVLQAMREGLLRTGSESDEGMQEHDDDSDNASREESSGSSEDAKVNEAQSGGVNFFGWDDDDDEDDEDNIDQDPQPVATEVYEGKGKGYLPCTAKVLPNSTCVVSRPYDPASHKLDPMSKKDTIDGGSGASRQRVSDGVIWSGRTDSHKTFGTDE